MKRDHRRPKRRRRWLWILAAVVCALLGVLGLVLRAGLDDWARRTAEQRLSVALDADVRIDRLRLTLWRLRADVGGVEIAHHGGGYRVTLDQATVSVPWRALPTFGGDRVRLRRVRVVRPLVEIDDEKLPRGAGTGGDTTPFSLRIDRLEVVEGRLRYADRTQPLELDVDRLEVGGAWSGFGRAMTGHAQFDFDLDTPPFARPLSVGFDGGFRWRGQRVDVAQATIAGSGLQAQASGEIDWREGFALLARGRFDADLDEFDRCLDETVQPLSGRAEGTVDLQYGRGRPIHIEGDATATKASFGRLRASRASAHVTIEPGTVLLDRLDARAWGGRVDGTIAIELSPGTPLSIQATGKGLDSRGLLDWVELPLPLNSVVDATVDLSGPADDPGGWSGSGRFDAQRPGPGAGGVPMAARGEFTISDGLLRAGAAAARAGRATFDVDLDVALGDGSGRLALDGRTDDAAATQRGTLTILRALGVSTEGFLSEPVAGQGGIVATIGFGDHDGVDLDLDLVGGAFAGQAFDRAVVRLSLLGSHLEMKELRVESGEDRVNGSAVVELTEPPRIGSLALQAHGVEIGNVLQRAGIELDVTGRLSGDIEVATVDDRQSGNGHLRIDDLVVAGERLGVATGDLRVDGSELRIDDLMLSGEMLEAQGRAVVALDSGATRATVDRGRVHLEAVDLLRGREIPLAGGVDLGGTVVFGPDGLDGALTLDSADASFAGQPLGGIHGALTLAGTGVEYTLSSASDSSWSVEGRLGVQGATLPVEARVVVDGLRVDRIEGLPDTIWARLTGSATLQGDLADTTSLSVDGSLETTELQVGVRRLATSASTPLHVSNGHLELGPLVMEGPESHFSARLGLDLADGSIDAEGRGQLALALASAAFPDVRASGMAEIGATIHGTVDAPDVRGTLSIVNGRARWIGFDQTFEQIDLTMSLNGATAGIERLNAVVGGGEIHATGSAALDPLPVGQFRIDFDLSGVRAELPEGFRGVYDGRLQLSGTLDEVNLGGRLLLLRGLYAEDFDIVSFRSEREYAPDDTAGLPDLHLDIDVTADGNVWVRNELAKIESYLDLHVGGVLDRPELTGRISLVEGGTIDFRDVTYRITSGSLDLTDPGRIDPYIQISAQTEVESYEVVLRVEGTVDRLNYELTSNPSLSQQDIISLLATGRTLDEGGVTGGSGYGGDLAATYFAGALTGRVEKGIKKVIPLDRVRIDPLLIEAGQTDPTTRVTVGQEVADNLYVIASSDFGATERQLYQIEWEVSRRLRITAERDTTGGIGGDIRYTDRYWWTKAQKEAQRRNQQETRAAAAPTAPDEAGEGATIGAIEIDGVDDERRAQLLRDLPLTVGERYRRDRVFAGTEAIRRAFVDAGRIHVEVDSDVTRSERDEAVRVLYRVDPGPPSEIVFDGATRRERKALRRRLEDLWVGSLYVEGLYRDSEDEIARYYTSKGYYTVDVVAEHSVVDGGERLVFHIDKGKPVVVEKVEISGAEQIDEERIRRQLLTRADTLFNRGLLDPKVLADDIAAVRNLYRDQGYLGVTIGQPEIRLSADADSARVILTIDEGRRFTIESLEVTGDCPVDAGQIRDWSELHVGDPYSRSKMLEAENRIRTRLDGLGYPDARVRARPDYGEGTVSLGIEVDGGGLKRVGTIEVDGTLSTDEVVVRRELQLAPGDLLSRDALLTSQRRLYRLGIFRNVRITYQALDADAPVDQRVIVRVEEGRPLGMTIGVGYDSEAKFRGRFALTHDNLAGRDLTVSVQGSASSILRRTAISGESPRIFGARLPTVFNYAWEDSEENGFTARRKVTAVRVNQALSDTLTGYLRYSFQRVDLRDVIDPAAVQQDKLENIRLGDLGLVLLRDTRDNQLIPAHGSFLSVGGRIFATDLLSDAEFVKLNANYSRVSTFGNRTSWAWAVRAGLAPTYGSTTEVPLPERYFAGGDSTLRGFGRDEVGPKTEDGVPTGGEGLFLINQEFRFPVWGTLFGVVFYDAGNVYRRVEDFDLTDLRHVLGTGLRLETPIGPIRLEYGRKLDRESGESSGELFLAIGSPF